MVDEKTSPEDPAEKLYQTKREFQVAMEWVTDKAWGPNWFRRYLDFYRVRARLDPTLVDHFDKVDRALADLEEYVLSRTEK